MKKRTINKLIKTLKKYACKRCSKFEDWDSRYKSPYESPCINCDVFDCVSLLEEEKVDK